MDGLSSAASAIAVVSLAGQVAAGVRNLYQIWSSFQDAPEYVQAINEDLKLLMTVLRGIEDNEQRCGPDAISAEVLQKCRTLIDAITSITQSLTVRLGSGKSARKAWAAVKTTFKQDKITKIQELLRDLKVTLSLAQQNAHFIRLSHQISIFTACVSQPQTGTRVSRPKMLSHVDPIDFQPSQAVSRVPNNVLRTGRGQVMNSASDKTRFVPTNAEY